MVKVINETKGYTNLPNEFLRDKTMSMRAKLILVELISFPPNWRVSEAGLAACNSDGLSAVKTAIRELEKKGYLERKRQPGKKGQFGEMDYIVTIRKLDDDKLSSESPVMVNSDMGKPFKEEKANTTEKEHLEIDFTTDREQDDGESTDGESTDVQPAALYNNYNKLSNNKIFNNQLSKNKDKGLSFVDPFSDDDDTAPVAEQQPVTARQPVVEQQPVERDISKIYKYIDFDKLENRFDAFLIRTFKDTINKVIQCQDRAMMINRLPVQTTELIELMYEHLDTNESEYILEQASDFAGKTSNFDSKMLELIWEDMYDCENGVPF